MTTLRQARFCPFCGQKLQREPIDGRSLAASELKPACASCSYIHLDAPTPVAGAVIIRDHEALLARPHGSSEFVLVTGFPEPYECIVLAPQKANRSWSVASGAEGEGVMPLVYLAIDELSARYAVDSSRIYLMGHSQGPSPSVRATVWCRRLWRS